MNPLSALTFYRRHKRRAVLLLGLCAVVTTGLYLTAALLWSVYIEPGRSNYMFLSRFSVVRPESGKNGLDPTVIAQIKGNPDVARVIPTSELVIALPGVMSGDNFGFSLLGLMQEDIPYILERCGASLIFLVNPTTKRWSAT